jgi:hypothetical protein
VLTIIIGFKITILLSQGSTIIIDALFKHKCIGSKGNNYQIRCAQRLQHDSMKLRIFDKCVLNKSNAMKLKKIGHGS